MFLALMLITGFLLVAGCGPADVADEPVDEPAEDPVDEPADEPAEEVTIDRQIVVGSKEFTEPLILGQITLIVLERHGIPVVDETGLGGTIIAREALERGDIDVYWEYTGTGWLEILGHDETVEDPQELYNMVREEDLENGLVWLDYTPFNNTYTVMMRRADAEEWGIETISDLAEAINAGVEAPAPGTWSFASGHEYSARSDGYIGLSELYGFEFDELNVMDLALTYQAINNDQVSVASGFATNPEIAAFDLVNLVDDLQFHAIYNCAPVVRQDALNDLPQIADILNPIARALTEDEMSTMNMKVTFEDYLPAEAAEEWLVEKGFIE